MKKISFIIVIIFALISFASCSGQRELTVEERFNQLISDSNNNLKDCKQVIYDSSIKNGDYILKETNKNVMVSHNSDGSLSVTVITTNSSLGSDFTQSDREITEYIDGSLPEGVLYFNYNFNYSAFSEILVTENSITGIVKSSEVSNVLNTSVNNSTDLNVSLTFSENKIQTYSLDYTSINGNVINITANYSY